MTTIDLNADVGEGLDDEALLPFLTSVNVACGLHAGGPEVMDRVVALARELLVRGRTATELDAAFLGRAVPGVERVLTAAIERLLGD